jgi:hypothetical protein
MGTDAAQAMESVVALTLPLLKRAGFRKRRHGFNRTSEPGLVQVVSFQMGPFEPPGPGSEMNIAAREQLGMAGNLYGSFTVNLGVYVHEMAIETWERKDGWVNEYNCQLHKRLGALMEPSADRWWSLDDPTAAHHAIDHALDTAGLPWLNGLASREAILREYDEKGRFAIGLSPAGPLKIAWLLKGTDPDAAEAVLRAYLKEQQIPGHREYVERTLRDADLGHLIEVD